MPLGTTLRKECRQGIQRLRTALRRLIISFTTSLISFIIFALELQKIEYNRHVSPLQKADELEEINSPTRGGTEQLWWGCGIQPGSTNHRKIKLIYCQLKTEQDGDKKKTKPTTKNTIRPPLSLPRLNFAPKPSTSPSPSCTGNMGNGGCSHHHH